MDYPTKTVVAKGGHTNQNRWKREHPEQVREQARKDNKAYRERHPGRNATNCKWWYWKDPERARELQRARKARRKATKGAA